jgi:hypothetical protein
VAARSVNGLGNRRVPDLSFQRLTGQLGFRQPIGEPAHDTQVRGVLIGEFPGSPLAAHVASVSRPAAGGQSQSLILHNNYWCNTCDIGDRLGTIPYVVFFNVFRMVEGVGFEPT